MDLLLKKVCILLLWYLMLFFFSEIYKKLLQYFKSIGLKILTNLFELTTFHPWPNQFPHVQNKSIM